MFVLDRKTWECTKEEDITEEGLEALADVFLHTLVEEYMRTQQPPVARPQARP